MNEYCIVNIGQKSKTKVYNLNNRRYKNYTTSILTAIQE